MVVRKRKKSNKKRGGRTQHGNTKNWRGGGSQGGHGRAGSHKHKYSKYYMTFGVKVRMARKTKPLTAINLSALNALIPVWLEKKRCEKTKDGVIAVDGQKVGIGKILGAGKLDFEVEFKNVSFSEKARAKIEGDEFEADEASEGSS